MRLTDPTAEPEAEGVKVTLIVQMALGATEDPQVFVSAKPALATMPVKVRGAVPLFVTVTICAALVEFTT